jgi:hypothetical protein
MDQPPPQSPTPPPPPPPPPPGGPTIAPRTLGEILGDAFRVYGQHWQTLVAIAAVVVIPIAFIGTFIRHSITSSVTSVLHVNQVTGAVTYTHATGAFYRSSLGGLVLVFLSIFVSGLLTGAITRAVLSETAGLPVDLGDSYTFALSRVGSIIWVSILVGLTVAVGFILLVIPGIWFFGMLFASVIVVVSENVHGTKAMGRSWNLVKGHWWHTFGTIFVAALLTGVVSGILTAPFRQWVAQAIASAVAQTITLPFSTTVGVLLYIDLRARKEGLSTERLRADLQASA